MKAVILDRVGGRPHLGDLERPEAGPAQVLVRVRAAGVNFADTMIRRGLYPRMPEFPAVPGLEFAGVVEALGKGAGRLSPGQRVVGLGERTYAEYLVVPEALAFPLPRELSFVEGAALPVNFLTAWAMLTRQARAGAGEWVLVQAAGGGVGTAAVQLARHLGLKVAAAAGGAKKLDLARRLGAQVCVNYLEEDLVARVLEATHGRGVDVMLEPNGAGSLNRGLKLMAPFGRVLVYGRAAGPFEPLDWGLLLGKCVSLDGFYLPVVAQDGELLAELTRELEKILTSTRIRPVIGGEYPLAEAARAWEELESRRSLGKLVLAVES